MRIKDKISLFEPKNKIENVNNLSNTKIGMLVKGKHPIYGSKKIKKIK